MDVSDGAQRNRRGNGWRAGGLLGLLLAGLGPLPAALGGPATPAVQDQPLAPDGHRGLGTETELPDLLRILRASKDEDRTFVERLDGLVLELEALTAELRAHYAARGAFALVPVPAEGAEPGEGAQPGLDVLHAVFLAAAEDPLAALAREDGAARAFAELYLDTRFRARLAVLADYGTELGEFRAGLAVLRGAGDGWIALSPTEAQNVIARVDLSASFLRAMTKDLEVLRPQAGEASDPAAVTALVAAAHARDEALRGAAFAAVDELEEERLARMLGTLFTVRFAGSPEARTQLDWRGRMRARAEPLRADALMYLPGTAESETAPPEVAAMRQHDRLRWAERRALEGLAFDPLDEQLVWVVAHASDFLWGDIQSRPFYDRYLALRGIRSHDDRTIRGRELTERELEALGVVQRPFFPGQRPESEERGKNKE